MPLILADVYLQGGRNVRLPTTPGRSVQFTGGHALIVDHRDMPHAFGMEGARVYPRPEAMPWAPEWLCKTDFMKAEVNWPEGWAVDYLNKDEFRISSPVSDEPSQSLSAPTQTPPVSTVDITDRQGEARTQGWVRPDDLLSGPADYEPVEEEPKRARAKRSSAH